MSRIALCSGGNPCCAKFGAMCPKSLTPEAEIAASLARQTVVKILSPTSMPCYVTEIVPEPIKTKRSTRPLARIADTPLKLWRKWFDAKTPLRKLAALSKVSTPTIRKFRRKLGYSALKPGGEYRQKYTREDAERIAKCRKKGMRICDAAALAGYSADASHTIASRFRDLLPPTHGYRTARR